MLFKPWLSSCSCVVGGIAVWENCIVVRNNVWIMGCTWLPNLSTYSLAVILPWRVIMGPTEYCTTILLPKPSQNLRGVSLLESNQAFRVVGFLGSSPNVNSSWCREQREGRLIWSYRARFQLSDVPVLWSWHHRLRIWALLSETRGLAFGALPWMLDLWSSRRTVFVRTGSSRWILVLHSVRLDLSVGADFRPYSSSLILSSHESCMPT
jgi:hypothetical protein